MQENNNDASKLVEQALAAFQNKKHLESINFIDAALSINSGLLDLHLAKSISLIAVQDLDEAYKSILVFLEKYPEHQYGTEILEIILNNISILNSEKPDITLKIYSLYQEIEKSGYLQAENYLKELNRTPKSLNSIKNINTGVALKIYELPDIILAGRFATLVTPDGRVLHETSFYGNREQCMQELDFKEIKVSKDQKLQGEILPLNGIWSDGFWHWLMEFLPSLLIAQENGFSGKIVLPENPPRFILESLRLLDIPEERLTIFSGKYCWCEKVIIPQRVAGAFALSEFPGIIDLIRKKFLNDSKRFICDKGERIYISRNDAKNGRSVVNEEDLISLLKKYNFEILNMTEYSFEQQISIMMNAKVLIGPHGAGMANSIFMPFNSLVLEMFSPKYINMTLLPIMQNLNHDYQMILPMVNGAEYQHDTCVLANLEMLDLVLRKRLN